ncbi:MAG TPA: beta-ketoacyl synthase N-terminal-like domain-containing protein [Micromonosporaceae bacterium]|jgi:3-oxoacyl-[acyl-carrier-protein] synthase II|nr:beta-ketoacyl synthase N-terminal-like domain-containing protein [Micromonosporaceae bacterium]
MMWAITGTGMVSSLGTGVGPSFGAYCRAESGLRPLRAFDPAGYRVRHAFEVHDGPERPLRASRWLCDAICEAVDRAGLVLPPADPAVRIPVLVGTGLAEQRSMELWWTAGAPIGLDELHFGGAVAHRFGRLSTTTFVNACSAGLYALAIGTDLLSLGEADTVIVAATDAITESMFGLLDRVSPEPPDRVRPFDQDRLGVILGEGAAAVVVEPLARARARGARVLAVLRGVGTSCDAHHVTAPLRAGIGRAMRDAHRRAGVKPAEIDAILAHGTGTVLNDETEALALQDVFDGAAQRPVLTSLKSLIGHTSGASGLMSVVTAVEAIARHRIPPTLHHVRPIRELAGFQVVTRHALPLRVRTAQVNAFGFGGVNAVAVLDSPDTDVDTDPPPGHQPAVVVTGAGLAGPGLSTVEALLAGATRSAEPFDPKAVLGTRGLRYKDRATILALCAVAHAFADAGLPRRPAEQPDSESFGVIVSSALAVVETVCRTAAVLHANGVRGTSPMDLPNASANAAASSLAIWYGLGGLNLTVSAGPASGLDAVHLAACAIRAGRVRRVVVVGVEPDGPAAHALTRATAVRHGESPDGIRLFDGAAAVVLEARDAAVERGARVRARVGGNGGDRHRDPRAGAAWFVPCQAHGPAAAEAADGGPLRVDLSAITGEAAAALGVVQCAAAAVWLTGRPGRHALLRSGGCWGEGYTSLTMRGDP